MKKNYSFNFLAFLLIISVAILFSNAQDKNHPISLWKIESENNTVYLMGSVHLLKQNNYPLDQRMEMAFNDASVIVFETNLDSAQSPAFQQQVLNYALYKDSKTLSSVLGDSLYLKLEENMASINLDSKLFNSFKPWFVATTLTVARLQQMGFNPQLGIDRYFYSKAQVEGKKQLGLETSLFQLKLLAGLSPELQREFIEKTIDEFDQAEKQIDQIVAAWTKGDLIAIDSTINKSMKEYPELNESLLVNRNLNWLPEIEKFLTDSENYLVIVGAGHMAGEMGLINLLEQKGYEVKQM